MSVCYDFQKWTIVTLGLIAITLIIGLVGIAHGLVWNGKEIDIRNDICINYDDNFLEHAEVMVKKYFPIPGGYNVPCEDWKENVKMFESLRYVVTGDYSTYVSMQGPPVQDNEQKLIPQPDSEPVEPKVSPEQDKPYQDCLADTSKTFLECQGLNPRK